jgi:hypothetical protein
MPALATCRTLNQYPRVTRGSMTVIRLIKWVQKITGRTEKIQEPCAATFQLRTLFLKYFRQGGSAHRRLLCATSLSRGTRHPNAPSPEDCIKACLRLNFLHGPDSRKRILITSDQNQKNDIYIFLKIGG